MTADSAQVWNGQPTNPTQDGWHWLLYEKKSCLGHWWAEGRRWLMGGMSVPADDMGSEGFIYDRPCPTPSELDSIRTKVWRAGHREGQAAVRLRGMRACHDLERQLKQNGATEDVSEVAIHCAVLIGNLRVPTPTEPQEL